MHRVLLVGLPASGKTAVAEAVASATGWPWLDDDRLLERSAGHSAARLRELQGAEALRSAESDVLTLTLAVPGPLVAGVASGALLAARDRQRLRAGGHVVWLRAPVPTLARRLARSPRPELGDDPVAGLRALAGLHEPLFAEVAHQVLDTDRLTAVQAARSVVAALEAGASPGECRGS